MVVVAGGFVRTVTRSPIWRARTPCSHASVPASAPYVPSSYSPDPYRVDVPDPVLPRSIRLMLVNRIDGGSL